MVGSSGIRMGKRVRQWRAAATISLAAGMTALTGPSMARQDGAGGLKVADVAVVLDSIGDLISAEAEGTSHIIVARTQTGIGYGVLMRNCTAVTSPAQRRCVSASFVTSFPVGEALPLSVLNEWNGNSTVQAYGSGRMVGIQHTILAPEAYDIRNLAFNGAYFVRAAGDFAQTIGNAAREAFGSEGAKAVFTDPTDQMADQLNDQQMARPRPDNVALTEQVLDFMAQPATDRTFLRALERADAHYRLQP